MSVRGFCISILFFNSIHCVCVWSVCELWVFMVKIKSRCQDSLDLVTHAQDACAYLYDQTQLGLCITITNELLLFIMGARNARMIN